MCSFFFTTANTFQKEYNNYVVNKIIKHAFKLLTREQSLDYIKRERKEFYNSIVSVPCPILEGDVFFRSKGFFHLINESNSTHFKTIPRSPEEQHLKLVCLEHAPTIITNATEIHSTRIVRRKDSKGRWKKTTQYSLMGKAESGETVKVIVEKVGAPDQHQELQFLSIMPMHQDKKKKRRKGRFLK